MGRGSVIGSCAFSVSLAQQHGRPWASLMAGYLVTHCIFAFEKGAVGFRQVALFSLNGRRGSGLLRLWGGDYQ